MGVLTRFGCSTGGALMMVGVQHGPMDRSSCLFRILSVHRWSLWKKVNVT